MFIVKAFIVLNKRTIFKNKLLFFIIFSFNLLVFSIDAIGKINKYRCFKMLLGSKFAKKYLKCLFAVVWVVLCNCEE